MIAAARKLKIKIPLLRKRRTFTELLRDPIAIWITEVHIENLEKCTISYSGSTSPVA